MGKKLSIIAGLLLISIGLIAQGSGTPSTLRVRTDSTHALMTTGSIQTPPYTTSTFGSTVLRTDSSGNLVIAGAGAGGTPSLPDTSVQFNNSGNFGGDSGFVWDNTGKRLTVKDLTVSGDVSTNVNIITGSVQSGSLFNVQWDGVNDLIGITAAGSLIGANNAEGTKYLLVTAAGASSLRFASDVNLQFNSTISLSGGAIDTEVGRIAAGLFGPVDANAMGLTSKAWISTAPSSPVACTSPSVTNSNGTAAFRIGVGTSCTGVKTLVVTLPTASNGWNCQADNISHPSNIRKTATSTTSATFTNYGITTGVAADFTDGDAIDIMCVGR